MLDSLKARLSAAMAAVHEAEAHVVEVTERSPERLAKAYLAQRQGELAQAEHAVKVEALAECQRQLSLMLEHKAERHSRIKLTLAALICDLDALDAIERHGETLNATVVNLQLDTGAPVGSGWHDAKLPSASSIARQWFARLEG